jgi:hypothetical protein
MLSEGIFDDIFDPLKECVARFLSCLIRHLGLALFEIRRWRTMQERNITSLCMGLLELVERRV